MDNPTQAVLMDAVGTLFRARGTIGEIYSDLAARHGVTASATELDRRFELLGGRSLPVSRHGWHEFVREVFEPFSEFEDFDSYFDEVFALFRSGQSWRLFPEVMSVLEELRVRGLSLGLVTNFDERVLAVLDELGIARFFGTVQTPESAGFRKPDPRFFLEACRRLGASPARTLVVGDDPVQDLQGAHGAGMRGVLVDRRPGAPAARFIIRDLRGIFDHIE